MHEIGTRKVRVCELISTIGSLRYLVVDMMQVKIWELKKGGAQTSDIVSHKVSKCEEEI
jgi:hypothetical protein